MDQSPDRAAPPKYKGRLPAGTPPPRRPLRTFWCILVFSMHLNTYAKNFFYAYFLHTDLTSDQIEYLKP